VVKGTIAFIDSASRNGSEARVSLRLENRYVVEAGAS
jgi:hypothetical protein